MKVWIILIYCSNIIFNCSAQSGSLGIGDRIPVSVLGKLFDKNGELLSIADLKGKLLILEFWNVHCSNCISSMPTIDTLQHKFNDKVQFVYTTNNNENEVKNLFAKIRFKRPDIPFIIEDTILSKLFPHNGDPLHVWIDSSKIIRAITFDYCTNSTTISQFLTGNDPLLLRRWDYGIDGDFPLLSEKNSGIINSATDYTILFKGLSEYSDGCFVHINNHSIALLNSPLINLYKVAFYKDIYGSPVNIFNLRTDNRLMVSAKEKGKLYFDAAHEQLAEWIKENLYSYELKTSDSSEGSVYKYMQDDLKRLFPYRPRIEKMKVKCFSLDTLSNFWKIKCGDTTIDSFIRFENDSLEIRNKSIPSLVLQLIYLNPSLQTPIINGTGYCGRITMTLRSNLSDILSWENELNRSGLTLVEKEADIDMLVIGD